MIWSLNKGQALGKDEMMHILFIYFNYYSHNTFQLNSKTLIRSSKLALWHIRPLLIIVPLYAFLNTVNPLDFTLTDEFLEKPFAYKFFYQFVGFWTFKLVKNL